MEEKAFDNMGAKVGDNQVNPSGIFLEQYQKWRRPDTGLYGNAGIITATLKFSPENQL